LRNGGHGRFLLTGLPADTAMVHFEVLDGRWLRADDAGGVVLNQSAATRLGNPRAGDTIHLSVDGRLGRWTVVGTVAEVGGAATAYTVPEGLTTVGRIGAVNTVRISVDGDPQAVTGRVEEALTRSGSTVAAVLPTSELRSAIDQHIAIFIYTLVVLAALMAVVGILGLASTMSIAVTERTREYGIMQALGATGGVIRRIVVTEGTLIGVVGCFVAVVLGLPLTVLVGDLIGGLAFGLPLPFAVSPGGLAAWLLLAVAGAAGATLAAAGRAARLTVRETLNHQ
jgi:putative ABC transport system permease protein